MTNVPFDSVHDFRDIESINYYRDAVTRLRRSPDEVLPGMRASSRDNARTPFQWDSTAHAGFTTGRPWIPVNPNYRTVNAAAQLGVAGSVFEHYRSLISLRHAEPAVVHGDFQMLLPDHPAIFAFCRIYQVTELLVLANLSGSSYVANLLDSAAWRPARMLISNYRGDVPRFGADGVALRPLEALVLHRRVRL